MTASLFGAEGGNGIDGGRVWALNGAIHALHSKDAFRERCGECLADVMAAGNLARRLTILGGLAPHEYVGKVRTSGPDGSVANPIHQMPRVNTHAGPIRTMSPTASVATPSARHAPTAIPGSTIHSSAHAAPDRSCS